MTRIGDETEFGSRRVLYVAKRSGDWFGTPLPELPNGELGWIRADPAQLEFRRTSYSLRADLSRREVDLRWGNRLIRRIPVTVGAAGTRNAAGHVLGHRRARRRRPRPLVRLLRPRPLRPSAEPAGGMARRQPDRDPRQPGADRRRGLARLPARQRPRHGHPLRARTPRRTRLRPRLAAFFFFAFGFGLGLVFGVAAATCSAIASPIPSASRRGLRAGRSRRPARRRRCRRS